MLVHNMGYIHWVESERVDGPYVVHVSDCLPMAFERVFEFLDFGSCIKVFDCDATLD